VAVIVLCIALTDVAVQFVSRVTEWGGCGGLPDGRLGQGSLN
jgi:hypothetical protein